MQYIALLRGINVGGKGSVSMATLKTVFENAGFENVITYINSGNVLFKANTHDTSRLTVRIEELLEKNFFAITTVVISKETLEAVVKQAPKNWQIADLRKYVAFIKQPLTPEIAIKEVAPKEGIDFAEVGPGVLYLSTKMDGLTNSNFPKLMQKKIYKDMTMRNFTTAQKLLALLEKN